ncbi:hypothetical protein D3C72_1523620 [compost metagenome]
MPPIQHRNGQQIKKADSDRKYGGEAGQRQQEISRHGQGIRIGRHRRVGQSARSLGDSKRSAELVARFAAGEDAANIGEGGAEDVARFLEPAAHGGDRSITHMTHFIAAGAQSEANTADRDPSGDGVLFDLAFRGGGQLHVGARTLDRELDRITAAERHDLRHLAAVGDQLAVDAGDQVARQETGSGGRRVGLNLHDPGGAKFDPDQAEEQGEDKDRQHKVGQRAARND